MSAPTSPRDNPLRVETKYQTYKAATASVAGWLARQAQKLGLRTRREASRRMEVEEKDTGYALSIDDFFAFTRAIVDADPRIGIPLEIVSLAGKAYALRKEWAQILRGQDEESDKRHAHFISVIGQVHEQLQAHYQAHNSTEAWTAPPSQQQQQKVQKQPKETDDSKHDKLANQFQVLSVEEEQLSDQEDGMASEAEIATDKDAARKRANKLMKKKKSKAKKKRADAQAKVEKEYEEEKKGTHTDGGAAFLDEGEVDPYFVMMCLLSDLSAMRNFVKELWTDYARGKVDLITASLTTNATFDIIRTYKQDCPAIAPLLKDYSKMLRLVLARSLGADHHKVRKLFFHPDPSPASFERMCDSLSRIEALLDLTCAHAFYFLHGPRHTIVSYVPEVEGMSILMKCTPYGPAGPGGMERYQDRLMHDIRLLSSFAQDVYVLGVQYTFTPDHFTLQWMHFADTNNKTVSLLEAFGAQMYLDMQNLPGVDLSSAFCDLHSKAEQLHKTWSKWETKELIPRRAIWDDEEPSRAKKFSQALDCFRTVARHLSIIVTYERDFAAKSNAVRQAAGIPVRFDTARDRTFLQKNPLFCGIIQFCLVSSFRQIGQLVISKPKSILSAGQLYYICQMHRRGAKKKETMFETSVLSSWANSTSDSARWVDMEYMFEMVGKESFFDGIIPTTNHEIATINGTLDLLLGLPAGVNPPAVKLTQLPTTAPQLGEDSGLPPSALVKLFNTDAFEVAHQLYMRKYSRRVISMKEQSNLASAWTEGSLLAILGKRYTATASPDQDQGEGRHLGEEKEGQITSHVALLEALRGCLGSESRALHFDMLRFHMRCVDLLTTLRGKALKWGDEVSRLELSELVDEDDKNFFSLGKSLFMTACIEEICTGLWPKMKVVTRPIPLFTSRALVAIDKIMQDFLTAYDCRSAEMDKVDAWHGIGKGEAKVDPVPPFPTVVAEDPSLQVDSVGALSVSCMSCDLL